jgi:hypothetical protein
VGWKPGALLASRWRDEERGEDDQETYASRCFRGLAAAGAGDRAGRIPQGDPDDRALSARRRHRRAGPHHADLLSEKLGQPIDHPQHRGASSVTGSDTVRRSDPDGYTLLFNASLFVLGKYIVASCPYDPQT